MHHAQSILIQGLIAQDFQHWEIMIETNNSHVQYQHQHLPADTILQIHQSAHYPNNNVLITLFMDLGMKKNYIIVRK